MAPRSEAPNQGPVPEADGSVTMALSPLPISSSAPFSNDFSTAKRGMEYKQSKKVVVDHLGYSAATKSQSAGPFISMCLVEPSRVFSTTLKYVIGHGYCDFYLRKGITLPWGRESLNTGICASFSGGYHDCPAIGLLDDLEKELIHML